MPPPAAKPGTAAASSAQHVKDPNLFHDVHSFLHNVTGELARIRDEMDLKEQQSQKSCERIRKDIEQETYESRESMNKFRYEFDELVHKRIEAVLEGLEEMEQNQKYKDRQQQDQLDHLENDVGNLKTHLSLVNGQWQRFSTNCKNRQPLYKAKERPKNFLNVRGSLGEG